MGGALVTGAGAGAGAAGVATAVAVAVYTGTALLAVSFQGRLRRRLQNLDLAPGQRWIVHDAADQRLATAD